jgi:hypothetical protein
VKCSGKRYALMTLASPCEIGYHPREPYMRLCVTSPRLMGF